VNETTSHYPFTLILFILPSQVHAKDIHLTNTDAQVYFSPIISAEPFLRMSILVTQ
jgi:hypothetical protein